MHSGGPSAETMLQLSAVAAATGIDYGSSIGGSHWQLWETINCVLHIPAIVRIIVNNDKWIVNYYLIFGTWKQRTCHYSSLNSYLLSKTIKRWTIH
jgi:hypothetical protein